MTEKSVIRKTIPGFQNKTNYQTDDKHQLYSSSKKGTVGKTACATEKSLPPGIDRRLYS
jgi:hypothetical protein